LGKIAFGRGSRTDRYSSEDIAQMIIDLANKHSARAITQDGSAMGSPILGACHHYDAPIDSFEFIQSQDSFAPWLTNSNTQSLTSDDLLVSLEDMKGENPVNKLRFYPKDLSDNEGMNIAYQVKEKSYETLLPRVFEELAVRVFCRKPEKYPIIARAFQRWCREVHESSSFPCYSQV
jgi:hypothetical protein